MGDKGENAEVSEDIASLKDPSGLMQGGGEGGPVTKNVEKFHNLFENGCSCTFNFLMWKKLQLIYRAADIQEVVKYSKWWWGDTIDK